MLQAKAGGIVPRSEVLLLFFGSVVSHGANSNVNEWDILFLFLRFILVSASVLEADGEGICGGGKGDWGALWIDPSPVRR
jgi:hypothetical protein